MCSTGRWRCICDAEQRERLGVSKREATEVGRGQREKGLEFPTMEQELSTRHGRARASLQTGDLEPVPGRSPPLPRGEQILMGEARGREASGGLGREKTNREE